MTTPTVETGKATQQKTLPGFVSVPFVQLVSLFIIIVAALYDNFATASLCGKFQLEANSSPSEAGCISIQLGLERTVLDLQLDDPVSVPLAGTEGPAFSGWSELNRWWDPREYGKPWDDACCMVVMDWESAREDFAAAQKAGNAAVLLEVAEVLASPAYSYTQHLAAVLASARPTVWVARLGFVCMVFGMLGHILKAGDGITQQWCLAAGICWLLVGILWQAAVQGELPPIYVHGEKAEKIAGASLWMYFLGSIAIIISSLLTLRRERRKARATKKAIAKLSPLPSPAAGAAGAK